MINLLLFGQNVSTFLVPNFNLTEVMFGTSSP